MPVPTISRRCFLAAAGGGALSACGSSNEPEQPVKRPNIVMIMADDMGYSDLGCYGGELPTPNLDRLGYGGMRFTRFYTNNMCVPTRGALMTGIQSDLACRKISPQPYEQLHPRAATVAEALKAAGYGTYMVGKWHLAGDVDHLPSLPCQKGFDRFYGMLLGTAHFFEPQALMRQNEAIPIADLPSDFYITDAISDNAVEYLKEAGGKDEPFFLYVSYTAAHWPLHAFPADIERHKGKYAGGWDKLRLQRHARMKQLGVVNPEWALSPRHPDVPAWNDEPNKEWQQRRMEVYAAQVEVMDHGIGRILEQLESQGAMGNTLICFQIDNGACHVEYTTDRKGYFLAETTRDGSPIRPGNLPEIMPGPADTFQSYGYGWANASNTPFRLFKQFDHEGGIMTPLIAHWPGEIQAGAISDQLGHVIDLMPTFLEAAGAAGPTEAGGQAALPLDGRSLLPVMRGGRRDPPETLYWSWNHGRAIRQGVWKLAAVDDGAWELYIVDTDGTELNDLAGEMPDKVAEMAALWEEWSQRAARL